MFTIGKIIELKTSPGLGRALEAAVILARINESAKNQPIPYEAIRFRKGVLTVAAASPVEAQELSLRRAELQERCNAAIGQPVIEKIIVKTQYTEKLPEVSSV